MLKKIKIKDLLPFDKNPRINEKAVDRVLESLKANGYVSPIVVNEIGHPFKEHVIAAGHTRWKALEKFGSEEVEVFVYKFDSEKHFVRYNIEDNKTAEFAEWDEALLGELAADFDIDLKEMEFEFDVEEEAQEGLTDEDEVPEAPEEPTAKLGQIWKLGEHRLMCGDSTDRTQVEALMGGEKADMVFTDPPYGMFLNADYSDMDSKFKGSSGGNKYSQVIGDNDDFKPELITTILDNFSDCKEVFLWGADYYAEFLSEKNNGSWIVWDKRGDDSADKMYGSCFELCWSKNKHKREIARVKWAGIFGMEKEHDKTRQHPTQKPSLLVEWFFERWGKSGDVVADLYGGSGSTLIACEKTNRKCRMMELDPKYIDVIIKRWQDFTGKKAELIIES